MGRAHASDFLSRASAGGATAQAVSRQQERTIAPASLDKVICISVSLEASKSFRAARVMRFARRRHRTCAFSVFVRVDSARVSSIGARTGRPRVDLLQDEIQSPFVSGTRPRLVPRAFRMQPAVVAIGLDSLDPRESRRAISSRVYESLNLNPFELARLERALHYFRPPKR